MKIIYRGGYNKRDEESIKQSMFYEYSEQTKQLIKTGKKVVFVNFAKPDGYYHERIQEVYGNTAEIIDTTNQDEIDWPAYDVIYMPGGDHRLLKAKLLETKFDFRKLKQNVVIIGDSAGAYVMGAYCPSYDIDVVDSKNLDEVAMEGLYPESKLFVIAHVNNPVYVSEKKLSLAKQFSEQKGLQLLGLKENEAKIQDADGNLFDVEIERVFNES